MPFVLTDCQEQIGTITLTNAAKRNSLSCALLGELTSALHNLQRHKVRAVVLRAEPGVRVWSSGLDVTELPEPGRDPLSYGDPIEQVLRGIQHFPAPVIAMIEGGVWGGACDLVFTCDITIGSPTASFTMTPAKLGVPYNSTGILHFINIVGERVAREMFFTAQPVEAERALRIGILNHLVPADQLEPFTYSVAAQIAENSPLSIEVMKEQLRILSSSHPLSPETFERIQSLRRRVYDSNDYCEGKEAFLSKRKPVFKGE
ncbi:MAG: methylmalonyl-CoA decarboxylase [Anaerolineae bacterium]